MQHDDGMGDCYELIMQRWSAACAEPGRDVVLDVSSPGGVVSGMLDLVRAMIDTAKSAGKRVHVHADFAASAGYALCMVADQGNLWASETAIVGSIGTTAELRDETQALESMGLRVEVLISGARKSDTNPAAPITPEAIAAEQQIVNDLAESFHTFVSERRSLGVDTLRALEASTMVSSRALSAGLIDRVGSLSDLIAAINDPTAVNQQETTNMKKQALVDGLRAMAEGDDEVDANWAKGALKALGLDGDGGAPEPEPEPEPEGAAQDDNPEAQAAAAQRASNAQAAAASNAAGDVDLKVIVEAQGRQLAAITRERAAEREMNERRTLVASRPDFDEDTRKKLMDPTTSLATVKFAVENLPRTSGGVGSALASVNGAAAPIAGAGDPNAPPPLDPAEAARMKAAMGTGPKLVRQVVTDGNRVVLGKLAPRTETK